MDDCTSKTRAVVVTTQPTPRPGLIHDMVRDSAEAFLEALNPNHGRLWTPDPTAWIFRGQANAEWFLRAGAVRDVDAIARFGIARSSHGDASAPGRLEEQRGLLKLFQRELDDSGAIIPAPSPKVERRNLKATVVGMEPDDEILPLMALAQHHGLPTLLLDWSRRARVAAYVAAAYVAENEAAKDDQKRHDLGTHLAVWALRLDRGKSWWVDHPRADGASNFDRLRIVRAPGWTNPNLRAQSGIFTFLASTNDNPIEAHLAEWSRNEQKPSPLVRLSLPHNQARRLLRLLSYEGVNGASMFPGADGVVRAMRERALWDKRDEGEEDE
jgi:hypothetical protein